VTSPIWRAEAASGGAWNLAADKIDCDIASVGMERNNVRMATSVMPHNGGQAGDR
jgi:hypothetical protein